MDGGARQAAGVGVVYVRAGVATDGSQSACCWLMLKSFPVFVHPKRLMTFVSVAPVQDLM
jgi:hypothetical protein